MEDCGKCGLADVVGWRGNGRCEDILNGVDICDRIEAQFLPLSQRNVRDSRNRNGSSWGLPKEICGPRRWDWVIRQEARSKSISGCCMISDVKCRYTYPATEATFPCI